MYKSCSRCGRVHPSGYSCHIGEKPTAENRLRNTYKWRKKREEINKASQYLCAVCREEGRYTYEGIEVHHIIKLKERSDLLLDNYNLISLCTFHHKLADDGKIEATYLQELARRREEG